MTGSHVYSRRPFQLVVFFTRRTSLAVWDEIGILERELAVYRRLNDQGIRVTLVTYGTASELQYRDILGPIQLACNRWALPRRLYERLIPWLHAPRLETCDWVKTNQMDGSQFALRAAHRWRKPLIARCGFMWSEFEARHHGIGSPAWRRADTVERWVFGGADRVVVTTPEMAESVASRLPRCAPRVHVIPNYVDTDAFRPQLDTAPQYDLIFVGRLVPQKNVSALLQAIRDTSWRLLIVGQATEPEVWRRTFSEFPNQITWQPRVAHDRLPLLLNQARAFILPSHYEGHPKSLLEAMACGRPIVAADSPGIRRLIHHGDTGFLCGPHPFQIRQAVRTVLDNRELSARLGRHARHLAVDQFSLSRIVKKEYTLLTGSSTLPAPRSL